MFVVAVVVVCRFYFTSIRPSFAFFEPITMNENTQRSRDFKLDKISSLFWFLFSLADEKESNRRMENRGMIK